MLGVFVAFLALGSAEAWGESKRLAIVVGNNAGSAALPPLRYAESDAGKMARVLVELGDVSADDVLVLQGRRVADLERAIQDAKERVAAFKQAPDTRTVLIFYFSGHSDGESIELGLEQLAYARLKALLSGTGADLRVAIIDACKSGAGFREKGGKAAEAFTIKLTDSLVASGEAFITSSAATEAALESSEVMGSYFTHNLISGLRGAADSSGDRLVTLAEAYRYAYDRTVSATAMMPVGAQHPSYDFRLAGQGELVLASLLKPSATLVLPEGADRSLVTDLARDQVVVEVPVGPIREVALAAGQYGLRLFKGGKSFGGRMTLAEGARLNVRWEDLKPLSSSVTLANAKGGTGVESTPEVSPARSMLSTSLGVSSPIIADFGPKLSIRAAYDRREGWGLSGALLFDTSLAAPASIGLTSEASVQARVGFGYSHELWGRLWLGGGIEAGPAFMWQGTPTTTNWTLAGAVAPRASIRVRVVGPIYASLEASVAFALVRVDDELHALALPAGSLGAAVAF